MTRANIYYTNGSIEVEAENGMKLVEILKDSGAMAILDKIQPKPVSHIEIKDKDSTLHSTSTVRQRPLEIQDIHNKG